VETLQTNGIETVSAVPYGITDKTSAIPQPEERQYLKDIDIAGAWVFFCRSWLREEILVALFEQKDGR